ncbi:uncharacterized protein LOC131928864 [Physella acuta]|uniref:uncharacterized protein LOC131928864 n=1 Tax=Physella acuta TaxID=109671 RepID=UPI0027DD98D4|nr:uncharacterized protein LOC131928864 [Physella acuta]
MALNDFEVDLNYNEVSDDDAPFIISYDEILPDSSEILQDCNTSELLQFSNENESTLLGPSYLLNEYAALVNHTEPAQCPSITVSWENNTICVDTTSICVDTTSSSQLSEVNKKQKNKNPKKLKMTSQTTVDAVSSPQPSQLNKKQKKKNPKKLNTTTQTTVDAASSPQPSQLNKKQKKKNPTKLKMTAHTTVDVVSSPQTSRLKKKQNNKTQKQLESTSNVLSSEEKINKQQIFLDIEHDSTIKITKLSEDTCKNNLSQSIPSAESTTIPFLQTKNQPHLPYTSEPVESLPPSTVALLSVMTDVVNSPKYSTVQSLNALLSSNNQVFPKRKSWPLLMKMISKPVSESLSVSPVNEDKLKPVVINELKLKKEIKCECTFNNGDPCWLLFNEEKLRNERLHHLKMNRECLDRVILTHIAANISRDEKTKKKSEKQRQRHRLYYLYEGKKICRETFLFIHGICKGRLSALIQHYKQQGLSARVHGNKSNVPHHALSLNDNQRVLDFIQDYASSHHVPAEGEGSGKKSGGELLILPPSHSKLFVHYQYKTWCGKNNHRAVSVRSFQNLWTKHLPNVVVLRGSKKKQKAEEGVEGTVDNNTEKNDLNLATQTEDIDSMPHSYPELVLEFSKPSTDNENEVSDFDKSLKEDADFDVWNKSKRKRKALLPRKVETLTGLPSSATDSFFDTALDDTRLSSNSSSSITSMLEIISGNHSVDNCDSELFSHDSQLSASYFSKHHSRLSSDPMLIDGSKDSRNSFHKAKKRMHHLSCTSNSNSMMDNHSLHHSDKLDSCLNDQSLITDKDFGSMTQLLDWQSWQSGGSLLI